MQWVLTLASALGRHAPRAHALFDARRGFACSGALLTLAAQTPGLSMPLDVSTLRIGPSAIVAELDLGKLKGQFRRVSWSPDATQLYVPTAEGMPPSEKLRHDVVDTAGGPVTPIDKEREWAAGSWTFKSDRYASGNPSLVIDVEQKLETVRIGTGSAGAADRASDGLGAGNINLAANVERAAESRKQHVVRLTLLDRRVHQRAADSRTDIRWGPRGTGAIAFTDRGHLVLLDQQTHKQTVVGVKNALLPAWSSDGARIAYLQKTGRRTYRLMTAAVSKP
jgi:hypothetical protein